MSLPADDGLAQQLRAALAPQYEVGGQAGSGAASVVYHARDVRHSRSVAIKVLRPEVSGSVGPERFLREIRLAARLQHAHIVPVFDSGVVDGLYYFVMPLLDGESLRERMVRQRQMSAVEALRVARDVADALVYAHAQGVVHRDIKPANIMLASGHAAVTDFGLAHAVLSEDTDRLTASGLAVGTPAYMSPELATGEQHIDGRSDLYSLGCVLYEMLAGQPPHTGRTAQAVMARHRAATPPRLSVIRPQLLPEIEVLVERCLAKSPGDRYANAGELLDAIERTLATLTTERSADVRRRALRISRRFKAWHALALVGIAVAGVGAEAARRSGFFGAARLDPNRIVVFPLRSDPASGMSPADGENIATYIGYALDQAAPMRWIEGWPLLTPADRESSRRLAPEQAAAIARRAGAAHYVEGSIIASADSVTVLLQLSEAAGASSPRPAGATGARSAPLHVLGLRAVTELLPALLGEGRSVDLAPLRDRTPAAVATFLRGERSYRRGHYGAALSEYRQAVRLDSGFALAAMRGALSAAWEDRRDEQAQLLAGATRHLASLPLRYRRLAAGASHYLEGNADAAVDSLSALAAAHPEWVEVWMTLGDVHMHLAPSVGPADSLARLAYSRAMRADSTFIQARYGLAELAFSDGDTSLLAPLLGARAVEDQASEIYRPLRLAMQCVRERWSEATWMPRAKDDALELLRAGGYLARRVAFPQCARGALHAVLHADTAVTTRWGALLILHGLAVAERDSAGMDSVAALAVRAGLPYERLVLQRDATRLRRTALADSVAEPAMQRLPTLGAGMLWLLSWWTAATGRVADADRIHTMLRSRADSAPDRVSRLLSTASAAHLALARGDSSGAMRVLSQLRPTAQITDLFWQMWESLGAERLALARLQFARGQFEPAMRTAALLDAPSPVAYLVYYADALELRAAAARALGRTDLERVVNARLARLQRQEKR
ncbi:MAG: protein kinase domain-containing protein [Gemmatimonadaceae bacterium]